MITAHAGKKHQKSNHTQTVKRENTKSISKTPGKITVYETSQTSPNASQQNFPLMVLLLTALTAAQDPADK